MDRKAEIGEKELALLCSKGDSDARKELYSRYAARLTTLCSRYSGGPTEGIDLMHDTMIKALQRIGQYHYNGSGSLYSWLSRIAVNLAIDRLRKEGRLDISGLMEDSFDLKDPDNEEVKSLPLSVLQTFVSRLPNSKRLIFNMFCVDGFSHKEIAERLGITEKSSSSTLARAKKMIIKMINDYSDKDK